MIFRVAGVLAVCKLVVPATSAHSQAVQPTRRPPEERMDMPALASDQGELHDALRRTVHLPRLRRRLLRQDEAGTVLRHRGRRDDGRMPKVEAVMSDPR